MGVHLEIVETEWRPRTGDPCLFDFEQARVLIGRGVTSDVRLPHSSVSNRHATILLRRGRHLLQDESSTNGTWLNELRLPPGVTRALHDGDIIEVGSMRLRFQSGPCTSATTSERTSSIARRLVREFRGDENEALDSPSIRHIQEGEDALEYSLAVAPCRLVAGRATDCQIVLDDPQVSLQHLEFVRDLDGVNVADLDSKNGFELNGKPVRNRRLRHGDQIQLGSSSRLEFVEPADAAMGQLCKEADAEVSRPEVPVQTTTVEEAEAAPAPAALHGRPRTPARRTMSERLVMGIAVLILAASMAGLAMMLTS